jgi:hypothetical protein
MAQDAVRCAFRPTSFVSIRKLPQYEAMKEGEIQGPMRLLMIFYGYMMIM